MSGSASPKNTKGQPGLIQAALFGMCPRCGARTLFEAPAQVAGTCRACAQPLAELERGGRLAGLLTLLIAALLITAAIALDEYARPPIWVHVILWAPLTVGAVLGALRLFKTASVYRRYEAAQAKP
ncbi:MAG: DUF983 domain-containing protein [Erythrobacter sp.]|uniref:DUF983 domain-containing protein n=1 Tax=Erythrobacter sp. TaxID=1042 RepID=UPI002609E0DD|nr:DUF983 domain-containing protein [Erythrobacter sp.]MDJ0977062.1 DUF983 domain-containing protein [Erythrobacter sp.]